MAFEVLIKQVQAIATVTGQMSGHTTTALAQASLGALAGPLLNAQLMFGDALRILALVQDLPAHDDFGFDMELGHIDWSNSIAWNTIWLSRDNITAEIDMLREAVTGLEVALDLLRGQVAQLLTMAQQLGSLESQLDQQSSALGAARELLEKTILPQLFAFRDELERILATYRKELRAREDYLWHIDTIFKFVLPPIRLMRRKKERKEKPPTDGEETPEAEDGAEGRDGEEGGEEPGADDEVALEEATPGEPSDEVR